MPLSPKMLMELGTATLWTFYYILEAGVKLIIPSKMFHKVQKLILTRQENIEWAHFQDISNFEMQAI